MMALASKINTIEMPGPTRNTKIVTKERYEGHMNMLGTILKIFVMDPVVSGCVRG